METGAPSDVSAMHNSVFLFLANFCRQPRHFCSIMQRPPTSSRRRSPPAATANANCNCMQYDALSMIDIAREDRRAVGGRNRCHFDRRQNPLLIGLVGGDTLSLLLRSVGGAAFHGQRRFHETARRNEECLSGEMAETVELHNMQQQAKSRNAERANESANRSLTCNIT